MIRNGKNNKSIVRSATFGILILVVCLLTCLAHIVDVSHNFEKEIKNSLNAQLDVSEDIISDSNEELTRLLQETARTMEENNVNDKTAIVDYLVNSEKRKEFDLVVFVTKDEETYYSDGSMQTLKSARMTGVLDVTESTIRSVNNREQPSQHGVLYFIEPVTEHGSVIGCLVGVKELGNILQKDSFHYLSQIGDTFLVDSTGYIQAEYVDEFVVKDYSSMDMGDRLRDILGSNQDNRDKINTMYQDFASQKNAVIRFQDVKGNYLNVSYMPVEKSGGLFLVHCYSDKVYTSRVQPVVFRSILTCIVIVLIMITIIMYIWVATNNASQMFERLAYADSVTGGSNLNWFKERASHMVHEEDAERYLVERFDIANFRYVNEAYGHLRADQLLKIIYEEAVKVFEGKEMCVRMDSDQFVVFALNDAGFYIRQEEMVNSINIRAKNIGIKYPIRLKCGIYQIRAADRDINVLIDKANVARKILTGEEKELVVVYNDKMLIDMRKIDKIESEMEAALRNGEFHVFIQPKWDLGRNEVCGGEALVRWVKENHTIINPNVFIPVFEKNGFVEQLDFYMLEAVCKRIRKLLDEGRKVYPISVNQSRFLLHNPEYINNVERIMRRYNIPKGCIELELTETVFISERDKMIHILEELKNREIMISMDDFGSGFSSLNMLKDVPFDVLKIDREFFSEAVTSKSSTWILEKIVEMAEGLGIMVLCEGVETKEHVDILRSIGCRYAQGFYFSMPMDIEEFVERYVGKKE